MIYKLSGQDPKPYWRTEENYVIEQADKADNSIFER